MQAPTIVIFGATGDLARQKLFPALFQLFQKGELQESRVLAIGRRPYTEESFRQYLANDSLKGAEGTEPFLRAVSYIGMDFLEPDGYAALYQAACLDRSPAEILAYLAVDPQYVPVIAGHLHGAGFGASAEGWFRLVLEKPFGHDLASAQALDQLLASYFRDEQLFRIDHYLAKETVQNILAFRFANGIFEPLWSSEHIDHVQITAAESEGIGTRGAFYDRTGAVRDLMQNHILQLLALLTMEQPESFTYEGLSEAAARVLEAVEFDPSGTVYGQYEGYRSEERVEPESATETYAMLTAMLPTARWRDVPFYLRTGKALGKRISEISLQFKVPEQTLFRHADPLQRPNLLTFRIQPDEGIALQLAVKTPEKSMQVQTVGMEFCYAASFHKQLPDAYERLLLDALRGDRTLSLSRATIEESWRAIDAVLATKAEYPLHAYARGSWGPAEADAILERAGRTWFAHESTACNGIRLM